MSPRLMVICLGGLAGAGALVCCDLDEGLEEVEAVPDTETVEAGAEEAVPAETGAETPAVH